MSLHHHEHEPIDTQQQLDGRLLHIAASSGDLRGLINLLNKGVDITPVTHGTIASNFLHRAFNHVHDPVLGEEGRRLGPDYTRFAQDDNGYKTIAQAEEILLKMVKVYVAAGGVLSPELAVLTVKAGSFKSQKIHDYLVDLESGKEPLPTPESLTAEGVHVNWQGRNNMLKRKADEKEFEQRTKDDHAYRKEQYALTQTASTETVPDTVMAGFIRNEGRTAHAPEPAAMQAKG